MSEGLKHDHTQTTEREEKILSHTEAPTNIGELQMSLMEELYRKDHEEEKVEIRDRDDRNKMGDYWVDTGYSHKFRLFIDHKERLNQDPMTIKLPELIKFDIEEGN
jgi:hypothetical protein